MTIETSRRHCAICGTEVEMPVDTLAAMAAAPRLIAEAVHSAPAADRDGWSPGEIAAHLADTEVAFAWRLRRILTEDEPDLTPFDQEVWASVLDYGRRDVGAALTAYAAQRGDSVGILSRLTGAQWERTYRHAEYGNLTLRTLARHKSDHDLAHLRQIRGPGVADDDKNVR